MISEPVRPTSAYLVLGTPRAGTSLLCDLLASTGIAGHPREYFWRDTANELQALWAVRPGREYLDRVYSAATTTNGVFGAKLMWVYLDDAVRALAEIGGSEGLGDHALLSTFFPRLRYVWIWREDVVAQGVSWAKAVLTGEWYFGDQRRPTGKTPEFDLAYVHNLVWVASRLQVVARRWFREQGVHPFRVSYEQLVADPEGVTRRVLAFLRLESETATISTSTRPQADALNAEWITRYRNESPFLPDAFPKLTDPLPRELA
jgi:LPS sulfotransferase NodH